MPFPVIVIAEVLTDGVDDYCGALLSFFRELSLPFAPTVGLSIHQEGWWCGALELVEWHETLNGFIYRVVQDDALVRKYRSERDRPSATELAEFYQDNGWRQLIQGESYPELLQTRDGYNK